MEKEELLAILSQGAEFWNKWREERPDEYIDFFDVDFNDTNLNGVNFSQARLINADFRRASLSGANLSAVTLDGADFFGANLSGADLSGARGSKVGFGEADLSNADLGNADLDYADLHDSNLKGANLNGASLGEAEICRADLSGANLNGANLTRARLCDSDLRSAKISEAFLSEADLSGAHLNGADFHGSILSFVNLDVANLSEANLSETDLHNTSLVKADFSGANLSGANLCGADLDRANLTGANLSGVNLEQAVIVKTIIQDTILKDCRIYGISAWDPQGTPKVESGGLIITPVNQPEVTVDDLEVAQFVYLLLSNEKIRGVLDTIGKKGVLILGRFSLERKQVLDALRDKLRTLNFVPMIFDFEGASTKDFTETVKILAGMCRFIIADITSPKSSPLELQATVPDYKIPFVPIIQEGEEPFSMFANLQNYPWMFDVLQYRDSEQLIAVIDKAIIQPALIMADELNVQKAEDVRKRRAEDYL